MSQGWRQGHSWSHGFCKWLDCDWCCSSLPDRRWCLNRLGSKLRQSWRQAVLALVSFICMARHS